MSYHLKQITKGTLGELSKVYEEIEEVRDSEEQGVELMILIELSDTLGAIESYLERHHKSITLQDLIVMSNITKRAFRSGRR